MVDNSIEQIKKYIKISGILVSNGIKVPQILACSIENGLLLQTDFGDNLLSGYVSKQQDNYFYKLCIDEIIKIQKIKNIDISSFCYESLYNETMISETWFFDKHSEQIATEDVKVKYRLFCQEICKNISANSEVFVHRDYHSRN
ncbi:MAG: hypothetical protein VX335_03435, partial [Pseudomonadota bacterium]|nr:hypothetical protein [Pseudomonadota bacterium]